MKKTYIFKLISCLVLSFITQINTLTFAQTASCWCSGSANICVSTAQELYNALYVPVPPANTVIDICGTINLGDLPPDVFPLELPQGVTLQGNYNMLNGTRIIFPYRYGGGLQCGHQQLRNEEGEVLSPNEPEFQLTPFYYAFAFTMQQGCHFKNICLQGPKPDISEQYMYAALDQVGTVDCAHPPFLDPLEGLCGGILMRGDDCWIEDSEIYGFSLYNVHVRPENTIPGDPLGIGNVHFNNSFIHNSKYYGFGYGIFGSGGGDRGCIVPLPPTCPPPTTDIRDGWVLSNSDQIPEQIDVTNTMFMENGKDADGAGHRYSFNFDNCSMGLRANQYIINQHEYTSICNDWLTTGSGICIPSAMPDCCLPTITHAGGESMSIVNSYFFKGTNEFNFSYPNTYAPTCTSSIAINPHLTLDNNFFLGEKVDADGRVRIANTDHHNWQFEHFETFPGPHGPLNTLNVSWAHGNYTLTEKNNFNLFSDASVAGIPHVTIDANLPDGPVYENPTSVYSIYQDDIIEFNTDLCLDAHQAPSIPGSDMIYLWRFHEHPNDLTDELRTVHITEDNPLEHQFTQIGVTNVNLIGMDLSTHTMSYIATHSVTVKPREDEIKLVFNIKDTYDGPWQRDEAGCWIDKKEIFLPPNAEPCSTCVTLPVCTTCPVSVCPGDQIINTTTGFQKYVKINGVIIWTEDIGADAGGWQRMEYPQPGDTPLHQFLCTDDGLAVALDIAFNTTNACSTLSITEDNIEIGLIADSDVDATLVRGINIYIDDVYINSGIYAAPEIPGYHNLNVLANGDFENLDNSPSPTGWTPFIVNPCPATSACFPNWTMPDHNTPILSHDEVRSGIYSLWGRIKYPANGNDIPYNLIYPALALPNGDKQPYFSVSQDFSFQIVPPRLANPDVTPVIDFTIQPNPSAFGTVLNGTIQNLPPNQSYNISIYTPDGTLTYLGNGNTPEFNISTILTAGVYYVKVWGNAFSSYKRIVVVG